MTLNLKFTTNEDGAFLRAADVADMLDQFPYDIGKETATDIRKHIIEIEQKFRKQQARAKEKE